MGPDRFGLVGGLAADRPLLTTTLLAFGLTALTVIGAGQTVAAPAIVGGLVISTMALVSAPLALGAAAPRLLKYRVLISLAIGAAGAGALFLLQAPAPVLLLSAPAIGGFAALAAALVLFGPVFGAAGRFSFLATLAAVIGMAGGAGLLAQEGLLVSQTGVAVAATAAAAGSIIGASIANDFAALVAAGVEGRRAGGVAAQFSIALTAFAAIGAGLAFFFFAGDGAVTASRLKISALAGACIVLAAAPATFAMAGGLALWKSIEPVAVRENRRTQAFRRRWRPLRQLLPASTGLAIVAIAAIGVIAAAFTMPAQLGLGFIAFVVLAGIGGGFLFFSLRAGVFIFYGLIVGKTFADVVWTVAGAPLLTTVGEAAATSVGALLIGSLALSWRDARSPRLNARETTDVALTDAIGVHALGMLIAVGIFYAAASTGVWRAGGPAAAYLAIIAIVSLLIAPPLMTALSHVVRRGMG